MANFTGCKGYPVERFGSLVDWDDSTVIPLGVSPLVQNCRYQPESVACRYGTTTTMQVGSEVTGLTCLNYNADQYIEIPLVFDISGTLKKESPAGSGTMIAVTSTQLSLPANKYMTSAQAFNREYLAFSDLQNANGINAVLDGKTGNLDQLSGLPVGTPWGAAKSYIVGEVISPVTPNGHLYRCTVAGTSHASTEPTWPTTDGGTVTDNGITWTENTPQFGIVAPVPIAPTVTKSAGAGTFAAGKDVYIRVTLKSPQGETTMSPASTIINTVLNDRVVVTSPVLPSWLANLGTSYKPAQYNVYEADVATAAAAPADSAYKLVATTSLGSSTNVDTTATGAVAPTTNNCVLSALDGNICAGDRNAVVFFKNRNGSSSWADVPCIMSANIPSFGYQIWMGNIPIGPDNTIARIIAFNVANGGSAGNYGYIGKDDSVSGTLQKSTVINDNTTTSGYFTFTDEYLADAIAGGNDVTDFSIKIQIPPAKAIAYSRGLRKMVYVSPKGYETGYLLSFTDDPESLTGDVSFLAPGDTGDVPMGWVELRGDQYALKSNSGHYVNPTTDSPSLWPTAEKWNGSGPSGPMAFDRATGSGDDGEQFVIYAHRTSPYRWTGSDPVPINMENPGIWSRINWAYGHLICVKIDEENKEVHFAVPLDGATKNTDILTINYRTGWTEPLKFSAFSGRWIAPPESRKWSVNHYPSGINVIAVANRTLASSPDARITTRQLLLAGQDGKIRMAVPDQKNDDGAAIDQRYQIAYAKEEDLAVIRFAGLSAKAVGAGTLYASPRNETGATFATKSHTFTTSVAEKFDLQFRGEGENFGVLFTNGYTPEGGAAVANAGFELNNVVLRGTRKWGARRG